MAIYYKKRTHSFFWILLFFFITSLMWINLKHSKDLIQDKKCTDFNISPHLSIKHDWNETLSNQGQDLGRDLTISHDNNIFITGKIFNNSKNSFDIFIAKYSEFGEQIWNTSWGGFSNDAGMAIDIDTFENLYISGYTTNASGNIEAVIVKFNGEGSYQWNRTYGKQGYDVANGLVINKTGDLFVVGSIETSGNFDDIFLLNYDKEGNLKAERTFTGADSDVAYDVSLDSNGNVFIVGYTSSFGVETRSGLLLKYNNALNLEYSQVWGSTLQDDFYSVVIDSGEEILIGGNTQNWGNGGKDMALLKFNGSTGDLLWNYTFGGNENDMCYSIAQDKKENIYLVGYTESFSGIDRDVCLVKFNASGDFFWYKTYNGLFEDVGYGIKLDFNDDVIVVGKSESSVDTSDILILKYSQRPDNFELRCSKTNPIPDGCFFLEWDSSLDANNYTIFESNTLIVEINAQVNNVINGLTNTSYKFTDLRERDYYFIVFALNEYGNTSSNNIKVIVQQPPGEFHFSDFDNPNPNTKGIVNFTWTSSKGANNYSIFSHNSFIHEIHNNGTLIAEGIGGLSYEIKDLTNGDYFYVIMAINEAGSNISNCVHVSVRRAPDNFTLSSNLNGHDTDGYFELKWTKSDFSVNYSIYFSTMYFDELNDHVQIEYEGYIPEFDWPSYNYYIKNKASGTYYYKVFAFNPYGNCSTNTIQIIVNILDGSSSNEDNDPKEDQSEIDPRVISGIFFFSLIGVLGIVVYRKRKFSNRN